MLPENNTIGLTLLWELPEEKLKEFLPNSQLPRIRNGKGVLMLFLASTENYLIGKRKLGHRPQEASDYQGNEANRISC